MVFWIAFTGNCSEHSDTGVPQALPIFSSHLHCVSRSVFVHLLTLTREIHLILEKTLHISKCSYKSQLLGPGACMTGETQAQSGFR